MTLAVAGAASALSTFVAPAAESSTPLVAGTDGEDEPGREDPAWTGPVVVSRDPVGDRFLLTIIDSERLDPLVTEARPSG